MRGEAHPAVQVKNCDLALAHGTGGSLGTRHGGATVILETGVDAWPTPETQDVRAAPSTPRPSRSGTPRAEGKFLLRKCTACGEAHCYPRTLCPFCFSDKTEWVEASGKGTIYTYSVMRRAPVPYAIAYVTLAEGPTMMTNIVDCDLDSRNRAGREAGLQAERRRPADPDVHAGVKAMRAPRLPVVLLGLSLATTQAAAAPVETAGATQCEVGGFSIASRPQGHERPQRAARQRADHIGHLAPRVRVTPVETTGVKRSRSSAPRMAGC